MLDFMPEDLLAMQDRYPAAIAELFDSAAVIRDGQIGPGELRRNVFDFADGIRLVISRNREHGDEWLVLSAGVTWGTEFWAAISQGLHPHDFMATAIERFRLVSCDFEPIDFQGFTPNAMVPIWGRRLEVA